MKVTEIIKGQHYLIRRQSSQEKWPSDWGHACGIGNGVEAKHLAFHDGDFIADTCDVYFAEATLPPRRDMIIKWADSLPNRMAILKFWEWMQHESPFFRDFVNGQGGYDIEKLLDRYHLINRTQLDDQRRALLEQPR